VSIQQQLGIPTRFIGTGEKIEDFAPFDPKTFINELL
jgi:fused signal recognition particle receptor